jgi:hypothetical protein
MKMPAFLKINREKLFNKFTRHSTYNACRLSGTKKNKILMS